MSKPLKCAVIGVGNFGRNHAEKYASMENCTLTAVVDNNPNTVAEVAKHYSTTPLSDYRELLDQVDAVSVVTLTSTHYQIAHDFLSHGKHVLIEKPIAATVDQADQLIQTAKENQCILQVGHIERFNPVLAQINDLNLDGSFIQIMRLAPFSKRSNDVSVILDLMIHDLDLVLSFVASDITHISAKGLSVLSDKIDIANARIEFDNGSVADLSVSRISESQKRILRIFKKDKYFSMRLDENSSKTYWKDKATNRICSDNQQFSDTDMLAEEIQHFVHCIKTHTTPLVDGHAGRQALAAATQIINTIQ